MGNRKFSLGIDTSNYTTSLALVNESLQVVAQQRQLLYVKKGEKGLRQSQALFEHVGNLPSVMGKLMGEAEKNTGLSSGAIASRIVIVAASERPRPVEGSYMPVFRSGASLGSCLASALGAVYLGISHQEGHIEAIRRFTSMKGSSPFLALHLSGGTTECLLCRQRDPAGGDEKKGQPERKAGYEIRLTGKSLDLSAGQLLDRVGVALGLDFPCGGQLDRLALSFLKEGDFRQAQKQKSLGKEENGRKSPASWKKGLSPVRVKEGMMNLSGIETQAQRLILQRGLSGVLKDCEGRENCLPEQRAGMEMAGEIAAGVLLRLGEGIFQMLKQCMEKEKVYQVIMAGGVSASVFLRQQLTRAFEGLPEGAGLYFDSRGYAADNAVGTALIGMRHFLGCLQEPKGASYETR